MKLELDPTTAEYVLHYQKTYFGLPAMMQIASLLLMVVAAGRIAAGDYPCVCTLELNPVCGSDGVTYDNPCLARCSGATVDHKGPCASTKTTLYAKYSPRPCVCPDVYAPVCGADGKTYSNACEAKCKGVTVIYDGLCKSTTTAPPPKYPRHSCICTAVYKPVCGEDGKTYPNACRAKCRGVSVAHEGPCVSPSTTSSPCACTTEYDPVCGADGNTYGNKCEAICRKVRDYVKGTCSDVCKCNKRYDPVCDVKTGTKYANRCYARCLGAYKTKPCHD